MVLEAWKNLEAGPEVKIAATVKTVTLRFKMSSSFPSDGVETFIFELFPHLVAQFPGQKVGFYKEAAALVLMPDALSRLSPGASTQTRYHVDGEWNVRWNETVNTLVQRKVLGQTRDGGLEMGTGQLAVRHYEFEAALITQALAGAQKLADASVGAGGTQHADAEVVSILSEIRRKVA